MSLEITDIQINPSKGDYSTKAFAKIVFNDAFCVDGIRIIEGAKGLFIGMPSKENSKKAVESGSDRFRDVCFPINKDARKMIQDKILEAYANLNKTTKNPSKKDDEDIF